MNINLKKIGNLSSLEEKMNSYLGKIVPFVKNEAHLEAKLVKQDWYKLRSFVNTSYGRIKHILFAHKYSQAKSARGEIYVQGKYYAKFAKTLAGVGLLMISIAYMPSAWYWASSRLGIERNTEVIAETIKEAPANSLSSHKVSTYQPAVDNSLSEEPKLVIPSAGINTRIYEAIDENYEEALKKGVWRVNNFGTPYNREKPLILAAHRYGYLKWSIPYRLKNSFYNLPKAEVGDTVEIYWRQRKYTYAIYKTEEGGEISDYSADLILYTCKDLESDVRVFMYARLLEI